MNTRLGGVAFCGSWALRGVALLGVATSLAGCAGSGHRAGAMTAVHEAIEGYHAAAARADMEGYVGRMSAEGVFLGTDAGERWEREEFRAFCEPYFSQGRGWEYVPRDRHVAFSADGRTAWFDEILSNEAYGTLRGSGVLTRQAGQWRVEQYNLALLVPNEVAKEVVELIAEWEIGARPSDP